MQLTPLRADGLLLLAALLWGIAFVPQQTAMAHVGPLTFIGVRFAIGVVCLLPLLRLGARGAAGTAPPAWPWQSGILAGLALALGAIAQQIGVKHTTVSNAGFITGLYVILVPILGIAVKRPPLRTHWLGAALAVVGMYLLTGTGPVGMNQGDLFVLASAFVWSIQILLIDRYAGQVDAVRLSIIQFGVGAALPGALALVIEQPAQAGFWAGLWAARWPILYVGVFSSAIAFTLQIVAQRAAPAAHAAIIFSLEAVFAAVAGRVLLDEQLTGRQLAGCAVILGGILCAQLDRIMAPRPSAAGATRSRTGRRPGPRRPR